MGKNYRRYARILTAVWFSFFVTSYAEVPNAQDAKVKRQAKGTTKVDVQRGNGESQISVVTKGVGNFVSDLVNVNRRNENLRVNESHHFSSTVTTIIETPALPNSMLGGAPASRVPASRLRSGLEKWNATLAEWKKRNSGKIIYEEMPLNVSIDSLNPCELGDMAALGVSLVSDKGYYIQEFLEQGLPIMLDNVELEDPATHKLWAPPSLKKQDPKEGLRLLLTPNRNGVAVKLGYGTKLASFIDYTAAMGRAPATVASITRSLRQSPKDLESAYDEDYFASQRVLPVFLPSANMSTNELEAASVFYATQEKSFRNGEGHDQKAMLSVSGLIVSHALRALKLVLPVAHYHHFGLLPITRLQPIGGIFAGITKDFLAVGDEVPFEQIKNLEKPAWGEKKLFTRYENKVVCVRSAQLNPSYTDRFRK